MFALLRRLGAMVLTLVISSFVIFAGMYAAPGDPVAFLIGNPENMTPERIAAVRAEYHLDLPFISQYLIWAKDLLHGDFGSSFVYQQPVTDLLGTRLPVTLSLVAYAGVLFIVIGVFLGIVSALRRGTAVDALITGVTTFATSIPNFVVAVVLISIFAVKLRWFAVSGPGEGFFGRLQHLTLPAIALALGAIAVVSRVTRQTMVEQQSLDHVEAVRSYGLKSRQTVLRHVLRNSLGPAITMCGLILAGMLAGTVVVEGMFGLNGIGSLLVEAINTHDFPVVQAILLYMVIAYMAVTVIIDLIYPLLDARVLGEELRMTLDLSVPVAGTLAVRRRTEWPLYLSVAVLALAVIAAVFASWVSPYSPSQTDFGAIWQSPSSSHWLGTDQLGRDLLSRIIHGARPSLLGAIALLAVATVLGVLIGVTAAWHRGWVDTALSRVTDVMFAFPGLLFVVLVIAVFDRGQLTSVLGMALAYAPAIAKFTRSIALEEITRPYVDAYRLQGVGGFVLCLKYLLPNLLPTLVGYLVVLFGEGLMSLASLNFLGFGSQPPSSEWGLMVQEGRTGVIQGIVGPALIPGLTIAIVVVATNVVGVRLSDKLAVRK